MLEDLKRKALAGRTPDEAWELFRLAHFPGLDHEGAAAELGEWARENRIEVTFFTRKVRDREVIFVMFSAS